MSKTWTTLVLLLGVAVIGSNSLVLSPILTDVASDLGTTPSAIARAIAAYGGATALSALLLGFLIDRYGARAVLIGGSVLLSVGTFGSAFAGSWVTLALAQALAGLAAGVMLPAIYAAATTTGTPEEGARILGRVLTGWSVSLVAGVPLSALVAERFGWHASFVVLGALVLLGLVGFVRMPPHPRTKGGGVKRGEVTKLEGARKQDEADPASGALQAFALPGVPVLLLVQFLFMTAFYGTYAFFGDHLRTSLGLSTSMAGVVILFYGIGFGLAAIGDGLVDRIGPARALPLALGFVALAYATMPLTAVALLGAFVAAFVWGFANHFVLNVIVLRLSDLSGDARGTVLGLNSAITYAGALVGPLALGALYASEGFTALALGGAGCVALAAAATIMNRRRAVA